MCWTMFKKSLIKYLFVRGSWSQVTRICTLFSRRQRSLRPRELSDHLYPLCESASVAVRETAVPMGRGSRQTEPLCSHPRPLHTLSSSIHQPRIDERSCTGDDNTHRCPSFRTILFPGTDTHLLIQPQPFVSLNKLQQECCLSASRKVGALAFCTHWNCGGGYLWFIGLQLNRRKRTKYWRDLINPKWSIRSPLVKVFSCEEWGGWKCKRQFKRSVTWHWSMLKGNVTQF